MVEGGTSVVGIASTLTLALGSTRIAPSGSSSSSASGSGSGSGSAILREAGSRIGTPNSSDALDEYRGLNRANSFSKIGVNTSSGTGANDSSGIFISKPASTKVRAIARTSVSVEFEQ